MRVYRIGVKCNFLNFDILKLRLIYVCFLCYMDKLYIFKNVVVKLKNNKYKDFFVFIFDDVFRCVWIECVELRKNYLLWIKERENVFFVFILWSIFV